MPLGQGALQRMGKTPPRRTVQLEVSVVSARGLVSAADAEAAVSSSASVALLDLDPVESELIAETAEPEFNLSTTASFHADDTSCKLLLTTPLVVSVFEGEAKTLLGKATLSLEPLMQTAGIAEQWLPLVGEDGAGAGEVLVAVGAASALMSEEDWEESMLFTLSLESLHKLPERWGAAECPSEADHAFSYKAEFRFLDEEFAFADGKLLLPPAAAEPEAEAAAEVEEAAPAPAPAPAPADPEAAAEAAAASICWEGAKLVRFLGPEATNALRKQLQAGETPLTLTFSREVKSAEAHFDSNAAKYTATCAPLFAGLLKVDTTEAAERAALVPPEGPFEAGEAPEVGKGKGPEILPLEEDEEGAPHPYAEAATYLKFALATSQPLEPKPLPPPPPLPAVSELVPKRVLPQFAPKTAVEEFDAQVASIVESMVGEWAALFPEIDASSASDEASKDDRRRALLYALNTSGKYWMFKEKLKRSVVRLVKDTMSRPTAEPLDSNASTLFYNDLYVQLTQRLHKALNGVFFPPTEAPTAPSAPDQSEGAATAAVLGALADEMELVFDYEAAATYHKERITTSKFLAPVWYDYALFLMRTNDAPMAEECSREAVALSPGTGEYLVAHGAILASRGNFEQASLSLPLLPGRLPPSASSPCPSVWPPLLTLPYPPLLAPCLASSPSLTPLASSPYLGLSPPSQAEVMLKNNLDGAPGDLDAWLLVALLYDLMGRPRDQRAALKNAKALCDDDLTGAYLGLARKLLPINCAVLIERALQLEEQLADGVTGALLLTRGEQLLRGPGGAAAAVDTLEAGLELARKSAAGFVLLGTARLQLGEPAAARAAFDKALERSAQPYPLPALLLLGRLSLDAGDAARAKELFLYACRQAPSCTSWLGAGQACHALGEAAEAEEALSEANVLNNRHPLVWGQLALLCLEQNRLDEAAQALHEAYKLGLAQAALLQQLGGALLATGQWQKAEGALLRSLAAEETPVALKLLGESLAEQGRYEEAVAAYTAAMGAPGAPAALVGEAKAQAQAVLRTNLNRPAEANAL